VGSDGTVEINQPAELPAKPSIWDRAGMTVELGNVAVHMQTISYWFSTQFIEKSLLRHKVCGPQSRYLAGNGPDADICCAGF